jgi:hypothetical protein
MVFLHFVDTFLVPDAWVDGRPRVPLRAVFENLTAQQHHAGVLN